LAFVIPQILGVYWIIYAVSQDLAIAILRPGILAAALLLALFWAKRVLTWAELKFATILGLFCVMLLVPSLSATNPTRALENCIKLAILCLIALFMSRALRHESTARALGRSLILSSLLAGGLTVFTYFRFMGLTIPEYVSLRAFKGAVTLAGIPLNAIAFTSVFSYICGMCLIRGNSALWLLGSVLIVVSSTLTGSRAPVVILLASALALLILNQLFSSSLVRRVLAYVGIAFMAQLMVVGWQSVSFKEMSGMTEGRWDLWSVAWQKFLERPALGYGFESWRDDLLSRIPDVPTNFTYTPDRFAGGYHNEYLTLLAEQGLIGFCPAMTLFGFLLLCSWKLANRRLATWKNGQWALFGCLFLLLRACIEAPGLFGYGQEPADYLAFLFVSIVCSRFSVEEDYLRALASVALARSTLSSHSF
jgi:O-antigen ligase